MKQITKNIMCSLILAQVWYTVPLSTAEDALPRLLSTESELRDVSALLAENSALQETIEKQQTQIDEQQLIIDEKERCIQGMRKQMTKQERTLAMERNFLVWI